MTTKFTLAAFAAISLAALSVQARNEAGNAARSEAVWHTDFEKAREIAKKEKRPMLVDFTGSDWCGWCVRLDEEVFSRNEFKDYAGDNLVLVEVDFPRGKQQSAEEKSRNQALAQKFGVRGYPTILLVDADGKEIARTGYQRGGAKRYVRHLKRLLR